MIRPALVAPKTGLGELVDTVPTAWLTAWSEAARVRSMADDHLLPPAAVMTRMQVADFDAWLRVFDANEDFRRASGLIGHHINRAEGDPNSLSLYMAATNMDQAREFSTSDGLRERMKDAGVVSVPGFTFMTPVRENIVWDRELPAFVLSHSVADFDRWLEGYDAAAELQNAKGIIGQAANRSADDPSIAVVYHQAESFDTLRAFLADDELKQAMLAAGVVSAPEVSFVTGGWAKQYT